MKEGKNNPPRSSSVPFGKLAFYVFVLGWAAAGLLIGGLRIWMALQVGLALPFWFFSFVVTIPFYLIVLFKTPVAGFGKGALCGAIFSCPVTCICFLLSSSAIIGQGGIEEYHKQMRITGLVIMVFSVIILGLAAMYRRRNILATQKGS